MNFLHIAEKWEVCFKNICDNCSIHTDATDIKAVSYLFHYFYFFIYPFIDLFACFFNRAKMN